MDCVLLLAMPAAAFLYDALIGERPLFLHPVLLYGKVISFYDANFREGFSKAASRAYGLVLVLSLGFVSLAPLALLGVLEDRFADNVAIEALIIIFIIYLLKTSFSMRHMVHEARAVSRSVEAGDLDGARKRVSYIVSRETGNLSFDDILSADVECVSESFVDGIASPLFYFALFGLYGCQFYRAVNSADSRVGYKTGKYKDFGYIPARLDDALNYIPARLSVLITLLAGCILRLDVREGWRMYRRYGRTTESPNAGQTMSVYAGLIGVKLQKKGHYTICEQFGSPNASHVEKAINVYVLSTSIAILLVTLIMAVGMPLVLI